MNALARFEKTSATPVPLERDDLMEFLSHVALTQQLPVIRSMDIKLKELGTLNLGLFNFLATSRAPFLDKDVTVLTPVFVQLSANDTTSMTTSEGSGVPIAAFFGPHAVLLHDTPRCTYAVFARKQDTTDSALLTAFLDSIYGSPSVQLAHTIRKAKRIQLGRLRRRTYYARNDQIRAPIARRDA